MRSRLWLFAGAAFPVAAGAAACASLVGVGDLPGATDGGNEGAADRVTPADARDASHRDARDATTVDAGQDGGHDDARDAGHLDAPADMGIDHAVPACSVVPWVCADAGYAPCLDGGLGGAVACEHETYCALAGDTPCIGWPFGRDTDAAACNVASGQTIYIRAGSVIDCPALNIAGGGTLVIVPPEQWDGGAGGATMQWTTIGVAGNAVIDGTITGSWLGPGIPVTIQTPTPGVDGGSGGEVISQSFHQAEGGAGGGGGFSCVPGDYAAGAAGSFGNGGGGGGGNFVVVDNNDPLGAICTDPSRCTAGAAVAGAPGSRDAAGSGGLGKSCAYSAATAAPGPGATTPGGSATAIANPSSSAGGGGGGFRGRHGGLLYLKIRGAFAGAGGVVLVGQAGGSGAGGGVAQASNGSFPDEACGSSTDGYCEYSGGGPGGGGAGGSGGALILRTTGSTTLTFNTAVSPANGGAAGATSPAGNSGGAGDQGGPGAVVITAF